MSSAAVGAGCWRRIWLLGAMRVDMWVCGYEMQQRRDRQVSGLSSRFSTTEETLRRPPSSDDVTTHLSLHESGGGGERHLPETLHGRVRLAGEMMLRG